MGAAVGDFAAGESFFEGGKTGPRVVFRCVFRGDAPKIENLEIFGGGVENELNSEDAGGVEPSAFFGLGALEIISGGVVVKNEPGGEDFALGGFDKIKGGKILA